MKRDKQILMMELLKLKQQQQNARVYLQEMDLRLQGTEKKQQQMMSFLAKAMQNPEFINQLLQNKEKRKELEEAVNKKRRRPIQAGESSRANENPVKAEPLEFPDNFGYEVSELEALALEIQGFGKAKKDLEDEEEEEIERLGSYERELDEGFWEELLNEGFDQEIKMPNDNEGKDDNVDALADRLGYLGSSPK